MRRHGFMLLEVVFAAGIAAIALIILIEGLTRCVSSARSIQDYATAQTLLANKAYEFRIERPTDYENQEGKFEDYPGYEWTRILEETDTENLWKQTIAVSWSYRSRKITDTVVEYRYLPQKSR
mgnify:CR=1 FL=1